MSYVATSVDVRVPVRTAYNQWTQFESFSHFMSGVLDVRKLDDRHTHWVTEMAGRRREFDAEIVEQLPDERIAWCSIGGDVRHRGSVSFQPLGAGQTRLRVDLTWEPDGLAEKAGSAVGLDRLQVKADLERFRRFVEERAAQTGERRGEAPGPTATSGDTGPLAGTDPTPAGVQTPDKHGHSTDDVVDLLIAQHKQVKELLDHTAAADGADKRQLFTELVRLLQTHEKGEQRVVHPVTRNSTEDGAFTANARLAEEERASTMLAEIQHLDTDSPTFDAELDQLRHAVLTHAEHEESEEFPKLRRNLAPERLRTMAEELIAVQIARN